jgi:hypothetical protein
MFNATVPKPAGNAEVVNNRNQIGCHSRLLRLIRIAGAVAHRRLGACLKSEAFPSLGGPDCPFECPAGHSSFSYKMFGMSYAHRPLNPYRFDPAAQSSTNGCEPTARPSFPWACRCCRYGLKVKLQSASDRLLRWGAINPAYRWHMSFLYF